MRTVLFGIDLQSTFISIVPVDQQQILHDGELCVDGAIDDSNRLAKLINRSGNKINDIVSTLDSHNEWHIAHSCWFSNKGRYVNPFTTMENINGEIIGSDGEKYTTTIPSQQKWTLYYLKTLKDLGRYPHMIWPTHAQIATPGHNIVPVVRQAFSDWCYKTHNNIIFKTKGSNPRVEHFSIAKSEVEDPNDYTTKLDTDLVNMLMSYDKILVCGQAKSHCVKFSILSIHEFNPDFIKKCVFLEDCSSSVKGFEQAGDDFVKDMVKCGMQSCLSTDI